MNHKLEFTKEESSLIKMLIYNEKSNELYLEFKEWLDPVTYVNVPATLIWEFLNTGSYGKFYLERIKQFYKIKKTESMPDKIIKLKIDVTKINKEWLFKGEKGIYLDCTVLYNEKQDVYENNGFIVQDVPKDIYKSDKNAKGTILGNCRDWATRAQPLEEQKPGVESGVMAGEATEFKDDLPF